MTDRNISKCPLTGLQQPILDWIWSNSSATSEQVRKALLPKHPPKDPSIHTLLRRLEERGISAIASMEGCSFIEPACTRRVSPPGPCSKLSNGSAPDRWSSVLSAWSMKTYCRWEKSGDWQRKYGRESKQVYICVD
jgi:predicted transcriptional regulator